MVLLSQLNAGDGRTFTSAELEEATDLALLARTVAHSLLLVGLLRLCTAVFRYLAWRSHLDRGAMGRDTSFRNFRRLLMYVTMIVIFNIVVTVFVVMVMVDNEGLFSGLSTENATVMVVTLSAARTRHEFDSAASSFFDALHIRNESCTRIIEFRRGDWVFTTGETYDLTITLVSADGSTTARLSPEKW